MTDPPPPSRVASAPSDSLSFAHPSLRSWFSETFPGPTHAQEMAWPAIARGDSTLLLAPTGSGKTLAAFLVAINRLLFSQDSGHTRVIYISPLKALGVDVDKNLRGPLASIQARALSDQAAITPVSVGVRSGDTPQRERTGLIRTPPSILITTPESLNLMLTSRARETLRHVQTVIVDEIHSLSSSKRGAHLSLSLERLEELRASDSPLQRIGLSATQRPLEEIAQLLGGFRPTSDNDQQPRPVTIVDAGANRPLELSIEVPVEDMGELVESNPKRLTQGRGAAPPSIWPSIHPRILELIRAHRSTMIFANSRRLAERLAGALNELAEEEVALAHHGSIAKHTRLQIEDRLKAGELPAIVATSSLELGIDMGAVDLVIQIECPASVSAGIQRVGRAGHHVGGSSRGVVFPKFRGDLLACTATVAQMEAGEVEHSRYPRNPLDVLAQHVVATLVTTPRHADELFSMVRRAAPFSDLPRELFDSVLDMHSGLYPSTHFAELRPRINYNRKTGELSARRGARLLAVANSGTIVDRGLYGVFLAGTEPAVRVGELDEEMVFECTVGDVFLLGASSWRVEEISHDRVLVTPAPGEPGRMPFWRGERPARPSELGQAIGKLTRELENTPPAAASARLQERYALNAFAAHNLVQYVAQQREASALPTDRRVVIEMFTDEVGDHRVVILSPFGGRIHAPWATAIGAHLLEERGLDLDCLWLDDGMVFRVPQGDQEPDPHWFVPRAADVQHWVERQLSSTALFAAHFRECAARSLLLPRRRPGQRTPLWVQRRRSSDLLAVAADYPRFPIVLEAYRECLSDVFDMQGLVQLLESIESGKVHIEQVRTNKPSPFAASLMFAYVGNFIYNEDTPLAERKAQFLRLDQDYLRALLGEQELRSLLDPEVITQVERRLQGLDDRWPVRDADGLHDLLLRVGDMTREELEERSGDEELQPWLEKLQKTERVLQIEFSDGPRFIAAEDAARYQQGLGVNLPRDLSPALLGQVLAPLSDIALRYAQTHGPFPRAALEKRYGLSSDEATRVLVQLADQGQLKRGAYLPQGNAEEWCHPDVLQRIRTLSLQRLRQQIDPVPPSSYARALLDWQFVRPPGAQVQSGVDGLFQIIEQLQGYPVHLLQLHESILSTRLRDYRPSDLDELCATGDVVWRVLGGRKEDCRVGLFLSEEFRDLAPPPKPVAGELATRIRELLQQHSGLFFSEVKQALGGFPNEIFDTLWEMVWAGEVSNDTLLPLRSLLLPEARRPPRPSRGIGFGRRHGSGEHTNKQPGSEGRWKLLPAVEPRADALVWQYLKRYGVLSREAILHEGFSGGFAAVYPLLKALEEAGKLRRGYFIEGLGAAQFALPGSADELRRHHVVDEAQTLVLAAGDPANPYGASLPWPAHPNANPRRAAGSTVVLDHGELRAFMSKEQRQLWLWLDDATDEPDERWSRLAAALERWFEQSPGNAWLLQSVNGENAATSVWAERLEPLGFTRGARGLLKRRRALHG